MRVVLKKDHGKLGKSLDVVNVKDGYARNFLIPTGVAVLATAGNVKTVAETKKVGERREGKRIQVARELAKKVEQVPCTIAVAVGEEDRMFGSVTAQEIAEFLKKEGYDIPKHAIVLDEPIKQIGVYTVTVKLFKDIEAKLKVWVVKSENN
jgi:large subunit ribosomal protein L9